MFFRRSSNQPTKYVSVLAAVLLGSGSGSAYLAPPASAESAILVRFVETGPGPKQTLLEVDVDGSATKISGLGPATQPARRFRLSALMLDTLQSRLVEADLPHLNARYGLPNPGGVFTVTTADARSATVYPPASGPVGLRRLNLYLEQIVAGH
jgi:hypothetical protein